MRRAVGRGWRDVVGDARGFRLAVGWEIVGFRHASTGRLRAVDVEGVTSP